MSDSIQKAPAGDPEHPWTTQELAAGLVGYYPRLAVWPDGDVADPVRRSDPDKVYGVGNVVVLERSPEWRRVRLDWVLRHQAKCMVCGGGEKLQVHHKKPFHLHPELELDPANLITLCEGSRSTNCHFLFGHGLDWKRYTEDPDGLAETVRRLVFVRLQPVTRMALEAAVMDVLAARQIGGGR